MGRLVSFAAVPPKNHNSSATKERNVVHNKQSFGKLDSRQRLTIETKPSHRSVSAVPEALSEPHSAAEPKSTSLVSESLGVSISMATDNLDDSTYSKTDRSNKS